MTLTILCEKKRYKRCSRVNPYIFSSLTIRQWDITHKVSDNKKRRHGSLSWFVKSLRNVNLPRDIEWRPVIFVIYGEGLYQILLECVFWKMRQKIKTSLDFPVNFHYAVVLDVETQWWISFVWDVTVGS